MDPITTILTTVGVNQAVELFKSNRDNIAAILGQNFLIRQRLKNDIKVFQDAKRIVEENNIPVKALNLKLLAPLLENAALEEEELLQDLWSKLIANYVDANKDYNSVIFINILKELTEVEASTLNGFATYKRQMISEIIHLNPKVQVVNIINLERLNLIAVYTEFMPTMLFGGDTPIDLSIEKSGDFPFGHRAYNRKRAYHLTPLGLEFLKAVA